MQMPPKVRRLLRKRKTWHLLSVRRIRRTAAVSREIARRSVRRARDSREPAQCRGHVLQGKHVRRGIVRYVRRDRQESAPCVLTDPQGAARQEKAVRRESARHVRKDRQESVRRVLTDLTEPARQERTVRRESARHVWKDRWEDDPSAIPGRDARREAAATRDRTARDRAETEEIPAGTIWPLQS